MKNGQIEENDQKYTHNHMLNIYKMEQGQPKMDQSQSKVNQTGPREVPEKIRLNSGRPKGHSSV